MFGRKKYEVRVPVDTSGPHAPLKWPWGWAKCPTCENGRRVTEDVCETCAAEGKTFDWTDGDLGLTFEEVQRMRNPTMNVAVKAGDTVTWSCNFEVRARYESAIYRCPFRVNYKVKKPGIADLGCPPEALQIHIAREKHYHLNIS